MTDAPAPAFEVPNAGAGPDPCSLSALAADYEFVVPYFQRDYGCTDCRKQVRQTRDRYDGFRARNALPVFVLPGPRDHARAWQEEFDLPFPVLSDDDGAVASAYGQPVRLAFASDWADFFGRMPTVVVVDARGPDPVVGWKTAGKAVYDRPTTSAVLDAVDERRESEPPRAANA
jgi:peroxiredoxin Q/BCP